MKSKIIHTIIPTVTTRIKASRKSFIKNDVKVRSFLSVDFVMHQMNCPESVNYIFSKKFANYA